VTTVKHKHFDKFIEHHQQQLLQEVRTKPTAPRSILSKKLTHINTAAKEKVYEVANMSPN